MILGADLSHFQAPVNFAQVKASGRAFVVLKATEGTTYVDPTFATSRSNAHAAGLIVGFYHFARAGDPAAEARWFLSKVGALQAGEFLVLDWEVPAPAGGAPAWCKAWLDAVFAATGVRGLIYMNQTAASGSNWASVAADSGLWLARYDNSTAQPTVPGWSVAMKQYSDKGPVPGVGTCDVNVFYGTDQQLLAYGYHQGADMPLTDADAAVIWNHVLAQKDGLGPAAAAQWLQDALVHANAADSQTQAIYRPGDPNADANGLVSMRQELADAKTALQALKAASAPVIDEAKLAAALLADPAAVQALGKAIADNLQLSPRA